MIASLKGRIILKKPDYLIIDVAGVGYSVQVPISILPNLPEEDKEVFLYIYTNVKEDAIQLYGFNTEEQRQIFTMLLNVSGIGPRIALNILSTFSSEQFYTALQSNEVEMFCRVPGLGKKIANRLILELKDKFQIYQQKKDVTIYSDALSALVNLGYKKSIAQESLEKAYNKGIKDIASILKEALKYLT